MDAFNFTRCSLVQRHEMFSKNAINSRWLLADFYLRVSHWLAWQNILERRDSPEIPLDVTIESNFSLAVEKQRLRLTRINEELNEKVHFCGR